MVFSSVTFLFFFLPLFLAIYAASPSIRVKNLATLAFSLVFYAWGEPWFVLALLASIAMNFAAGILIDQADENRRRLNLAVAVALNLTMLGVFKYTTFLIGNMNLVLGPLHLGIPPPRIELPLGISFFTFHCISYITDVYRRRFHANRSLVQVALYISLFPQLVAGPIVRYKTVANQLGARRHTLAQASAGARIFVLGLAQKVLVADLVAPIADAVFDGSGHHGLLAAWTGLIAYSIQIYFDFAGYSNMAIGLGICLGFTFPRNFRMPYTSRSITEFWRRWHISLSTWLRDYLYIPLGGNRGGAAQTYRNLVTVFVLCGLWHGASWNFVLWGVWHGLFLVLERMGLGRVLARLSRLVATCYTLLVVMFGWVLFRTTGLHNAAAMYSSLFGGYRSAGTSLNLHLAMQPVALIALAAGGVLCFVRHWPRVFWPGPVASGRTMALAQEQGAILTILDTGALILMLVLTLTVVAAGTYSPFLYFRF